MTCFIISSNSLHLNSVFSSVDWNEEEEGSCEWRKHAPVDHAESGVEREEHHELPVQQLVDAPAPPEQQPVEAEESGVGHFAGIRDGHRGPTYGRKSR